MMMIVYFHRTVKNIRSQSMERRKEKLLKSGGGSDEQKIIENIKL
jgi:hypothetical protein